jgi:hypothetical protein
MHGVRRPARIGGGEMTDQVAIVAEIRPGKRGELESLLEQGPPFDPALEGFEHHEVFVGDTDVVFVFTGPGAMSQLERMAASQALIPHVLKLSQMLAAPRILHMTFEWGRQPARDRVG